MGHGTLRIRHWWLGLLLVLALVGTVHAQGAGSLEGRIVNGTADGPEMEAGVPVTLRVLRGGNEVDTLETVTDADGRFRFEGLDTDPSLEYWPEAVYLGVPYSNDEPYQFDSEQALLDVTLTVFETTMDDDSVRLDSVHFIIESFDQVLRVSEIHLFSNTGDRTYVGQVEGEKRLTIDIPLPENAVGLAFQQDISEERFVEVEGGLMDSEPVPPGQEASLVFISYHLMVGESPIPLERRFAYPVDTLNVLAAEPGLALRSEQLQARGVESFQGRQYQFFVGRDFPPDTPLVLELLVEETTGAADMPAAPAEGDPAAPAASTRGNQGLFRWLGLVLAGLGVVGAVVYSLATRRPSAAPALRRSLTSDPKARRLLADLADLESAFESGQVNQTTYERRRAELYEAIKSL
ncbi:MAG: hypothetical protein PVH17_10945 [Anaerolineae bacterium]|jgi:hypothetical protein